MNKQQKNEFFSELAIAMNLSHLSTVKQNYYGMVSMVARKLKKGGEIRFPDFGTFYMQDYKAKKINDVRTGNPRIVPACKVLKFKPDYKLNYYVKN